MTIRHPSLLALPSVLLFAVIGCTTPQSASAPEPVEAGQPVDPKPDGAVDSKADQWTSADDPALFSEDLEYTLANLPQQGEAANIPWASSYWPVYQDSINFRWAGAESESPAAKYGAAFGVADVEAKVSSSNGVDNYSSRTACKETSDCNADIGESCAKRTGAEEGFCIPTWWGICHAWAPAAIMEAEPVHPVTRNGVTFQVNDIKALLTISYDRSSSKFVSLRCNEDDSQGEIEYDGYDRPTGDDAECKDTNPGTYHVLLANYIGLKGESFVEDRTFDDEVWNQPLRGYRVVEMTEVGAQKANALVGVQPTGANVVNHSGEVAHDTWKHYEAIEVDAGATVTVTMTGTEDADLYVKVGAQPTSSAYDCRPWANGSAETCEVAIPAGQTQLFVSVHGYADAASTFEIVVAPDQMAGIPTHYLFNDQAAKLFYVRSEVDYIGESPSETDGNLAHDIDRYTHTDHYEYLLEVDAGGKVIGGEWLGASKKAHPDFLWLPTGRRNLPIAGGAINFDLVKSLLDESIAGPTDSGFETVTMKDGATVAKSEWKHFGPFETAPGAVVVVLSGDGDADLYVRNGAQPTAATYDCRPYVNGSAETCTLSGPGAYYVSVHGYAASTFEFTITFNQGGGGDEPGDDEPGDDDPAPAHLNVTDHVAQDELKVFALDVQAGQRVLVRTQAAHDIDLYVKMNLAPTTNNYDTRAYTYSGNEVIDFTAQAAGQLFIGVHGWEASDFVLTTADE